MNKIEKEIDGYGEEKEEGKKGEEDGNGNRKTKTDPEKTRYLALVYFDFTRSMMEMEMVKETKWGMGQK